MQILERQSKATSATARTIGRNTFYGIGANLAQTATRLVTVPIVIAHLGLGGYGIWNIVMMTATYMRFGSVGIKTAFQKYVAEATGNDDYETAAKLLSTGCVVMLILSVAGLIPIACLSWPIAAMMGVPPLFMKSTAQSITLLALIMVMSNVGAAFEGIVMGGHRIDIVRKVSTVLTVCEAVFIVLVLHLGHGIFAMAVVMGISELIYISACYMAAHGVVPEIRLGMRHVTREVIPELFRFAGSYQLVNFLEVLYVSIVPFAVLRVFGADSAGVYAVVTRVVTAAAILNDAFLPPILSGGTMVYASGSAERMQGLMRKAFKVTLILGLFPLGFVAIFGTTLAYAWTGQSDRSFRMAFLLVSLRALFAAFSLLSLVLYRVSGKALMDNLRQLLRILVILVAAVFARQLGFYGVLTGLAVAELLGLVLMFFALSKTFRPFRAASLLPDTVRLIVAACLILGVGVISSLIPMPGELSGRIYATVRSIEIAIVCSVVAWPLLRSTGSVTVAEGKAFLGSFTSSRIA